MAKNQIFPKHGICAGIQQTKQPFIKHQIQKNLSKFFSKLKKSYFRLIFHLFSPICGKKKFQKTKLDIFLVDNEFKNLQWKILNLISTHFVHNNQCINQGLGTACQGTSTMGLSSRKERKISINILKLKVVHLAILTFTK